VLHLGEINNDQRAAWCQTIQAFDESDGQARQIALFPKIARGRRWMRCGACPAQRPAATPTTAIEAEFDILLCDLTSTYFEYDPPAAGKRRFGHSRDKRSDCVQVVIALVVTPDGLPLAYEVMPGNTADKATLRDFIKRIEAQYGKVGRTWVMDRGIPTEDVLAEMRASETPVSYLVGTPRGRLNQLEQTFLSRPWTAVRDSVQVKLVEHDGELYVLARSGARQC